MSLPKGVNKLSRSFGRHLRFDKNSSNCCVKDEYRYRLSVLYLTRESLPYKQRFLFFAKFDLRDIEIVKICCYNNLQLIYV